MRALDAPSPLHGPVRCGARIAAVEEGPEPSQVTVLLQRLSAGEAGAADELIPLVYQELRGLARRRMADQPAQHTLGTTGLVHEAYLRLAGGSGGPWEGRRHFLRVASRAMRSVLVDHARRKQAEKRGGSRSAEPLDELCALYEERSLDLVALDEALEGLATKDEELARIVELRFFGGLENAEVAEVLGCSTRTVERGWRTARSWLSTRLGPEDEPPRGP